MFSALFTIPPRPFPMFYGPTYTHTPICTKFFAPSMTFLYSRQAAIRNMEFRTVGPPGARIISPCNDPSFCGTLSPLLLVGLIFFFPRLVPWRWRRGTKKAPFEDALASQRCLPATHSLLFSPPQRVDMFAKLSRCAALLRVSRSRIFLSGIYSHGAGAHKAESYSQMYTLAEWRRRSRENYKLCICLQPY